MEAGQAAAAARGRMDAVDGVAWAASEVLGQRMEREARQAQAAVAAVSVVAAVSLATCARLHLSSQSMLVTTSVLPRACLRWSADRPTRC